MEHTPPEPRVRDNQTVFVSIQGEDGTDGTWVKPSTATLAQQMQGITLLGVCTFCGEVEIIAHAHKMACAYCLS